MTPRRSAITLTALAVWMLAGVAAACDIPRPPASPTPFSSGRSIEPLSLGGQVTACGAPVADAYVRIASGPNVGKSTVTDSAGQYAFSGLQASAFNLVVSAKEMVTRSVPVTLEADLRVDVILGCIPVASAVVTGVATDDDGAPVVGATIKVAAYSFGQSNPPLFFGVTDGAGAYRVALEGRFSGSALDGSVRGDADGHEHYFSYLTFTAPEVIRNLRLYRITRIAAGESTMVTVRPGDTLCGHDDELACRTVRVVVPARGRLTMNCEPKGNDNGGPGLTIVGYNDRTSPGQPWFVNAGDVSVEVGMWFTWPQSQSCLLTTAFQPTLP